MSYKAIYTYAWDLAETGVTTAAREFRDLGLDTVTIAGSYHAGKFMRPHGQAGKVYFPDDGTVYFNADPSRYGGIKPVANRLLGERDVLRELVDDGSMAVNVWLVLLHNTRLGMAHPDAVVRNAFGDPYYYNLCPSAPDARAYAIGLAKDVTTSYPVGGISLEAPGFTPYAHGYHHEFALMKSNPWLENMLGLCFCDHCVTAAEKAGIDARRFKAEVVADIGAYRQRHRRSPPIWPRARARRHRGQGLRAISIPRRVVTSLVAEIRRRAPDANVAVIPGGAAVRRLGTRAATWRVCRNQDHRGMLYEPNAMRVKADLRHPPAA